MKFYPLTNHRSLIKVHLILISYLGITLNKEKFNPIFMSFTHLELY
jgi:hypothetical protein